MNPDTTKSLVIGVPQLPQQLPDFTITLCGKQILSTPIAKDLGVFLGHASPMMRTYEFLLLVVWTN